MKTKKNKPSFFQGGPRNVLITVLLIVASIAFLTKLTQFAREVNELSYSQFLQKIEANEIKKVHINGQEVVGTLKNDALFETVVPQTDQYLQSLKDHNIEVSVANGAGQMVHWYVLIFLIFLVLLVVIWYFFKQVRNSSGNNGALLPFGKSRARMFMPSTIKENFDSVAGAVEAKEELKDVVDFLRNPTKYRRLGAKITRGVLLVGEPGNGKTLLAKAVAGEANCPFFSISGSDFIEVFVGVGAARVRDLFAQARKYAPSIIFIDELDAVGRQRGVGLGGGHDEREQTLNQLLTEMDGFQTKEGSVIVLAATNRPDVLDKAILRPGRFDRRVEVPYPDLIAREQILKVHAKEVQMDPTVDLSTIARGTPGFSGADLASLINEAAINASKNNQDLVTIHDFEAARDKILMGKEIKSMIRSPEELRTIAYHEAGHALLRVLFPQHSDPLYKVSIVPRGRALGVTHSLPEKDQHLFSKEQFEASILNAMGGRAAEEVIMGTVTTGSYNDFDVASGYARDMVSSYGMSDLGLVVYSQQSGDFAYSQKTAERIDEKVNAIIQESYAKALETLRANRDKLELLANKLLERETLQASEVYELLNIEPRADFKLS